MSEWKEGILSDVAEIIMGQSPTGETCNTNGVGVPLLNGPTEFGIKYPEPLQFTSEPKKFSKKNDILFCVRGSTTGKMNWADQEYALGRGLAAIRPKNGEECRYFIRGVIDFNLSLLLASATGSTFPNVSRDQLYGLEILVPPLEEQKAIASVLSSLDDKIDLLHRQNKTLEAMAETLFRQWFVVEAQEGCRLEKLGDCVTISYGKNLPTKNLLAEGFPVFGANGQIGFYDRYTYEDPQVLVSCRGEASGKVNISLPKSFVTNNSLVLERNKNPEISFEFLKYWSLSYDFNLHVSGSAQPQITIDGLYDAEFIFPDVEVISSFTNAVKSAEEKRYANALQIRTLETLRDTLLPKLMSGEVRVDYTPG